MDQQQEVNRLLDRIFSTNLARPDFAPGENTSTALMNQQNFSSGHTGPAGDWISVKPSTFRDLSRKVAYRQRRSTRWRHHCSSRQCGFRASTYICLDTYNRSPSYTGLVLSLPQLTEEDSRAPASSSELPVAPFYFLSASTHAVSASTVAPAATASAAAAESKGAVAHLLL